MWRNSSRNHDGAVEELDKLINGNAATFNQAALAARLAQARQNNAGVQVNQVVKQKFGNNDPDFAGVEFEWPVVFKIIKRGTVVEVKVSIGGSMSDGTYFPEEEKSAFRTHILTAWNVATVIVEEAPNRTRYYDLMFDLEWVDPGSPQPKYIVDVHKLHDRDNMRDWTFGNREACIHEFGHMIGCPDEYNTVSLQGFGQVIHDAAMYSQAGYTTNSIMNNPGSSGRIHDRHFSFVARHCRQIMKAPTEIKILRRTGPTDVEEVRQLMVAAAHGRRRALGFDDD
ncbi:hypothetical protein VVD49_13940 [Uliginosibacterium sp. H3]|uniref:Uncharacterized protein n=1 Tax=Uliginosibacterium silvisoli TaxID=3114758 RepID=A0ABU6K5B5_9RHOO|nr:hypothetical protein [Uliginosibacterium sp. H3]